MHKVYEMTEGQSHPIQNESSCLSPLMKTKLDKLRVICEVAGKGGSWSSCHVMSFWFMAESLSHWLVCMELCSFLYLRTLSCGSSHCVVWLKLTVLRRIWQPALHNRLPPWRWGGTFLCNISACWWDCTQKTVFIIVPSTRTSNHANCDVGNFQELDVGLANGIRAMNITHTGELGYVLYIPNEVCEVTVWQVVT